MRSKKFPLAAAILLLAAFLLPSICAAQSPGLTVSAGSAGQASTLTIGSDSQRGWKRFMVTAGSGGTFNVISAEHGTGDDGGIYVYTLSVSAGSAGTISPPAPPDTLPLASLTSSVSAAIVGVDGGAVGAMAGGYAAVAQQIDAGAITTPTQVYLVTGVQLLSLTADQRAAVQPVTTAVAAWLNAQQTAGKLDETKMADYARVFHAIAAAMAPKVGRASAGKPGHPRSGSTPARPAEAPAAAISPCASGHCPLQQPATVEPRGWFFRRR